MLVTHSFRRDIHVISLIGLAHGVSHFFQLALPSLFPLIKAEFGVNYTQLGLLMTVFYLVSGVGQALSGFFVDRFGAIKILLAGLLSFFLGCVIAGHADHYFWFFPVVVLFGIGNCGFHPADYSVLNHKVSTARLGHAFSTHGISGNIGYALAPLFMVAVSSIYGWRSAMLLAGVVGVGMMALLWWQRAVLRSEGDATQSAATVKQKAISSVAQTQLSNAALFFNVPILSCFAFFVCASISNVGLQNFAPSLLMAQYHINGLLAASALTAYLLGGAAGIFAGGFAASHSDSHERIAAAGMLSCAVLLLILATGIVPISLLIGMLALTGFAFGITTPSRDMLVRKSAPSGATGRVYGFVYSGVDLGAAIGPAMLGAFLDYGRPDFGFVMVALVLCLNIWIALQNLQARRWAERTP